jgi:hypothetical protein
MVRILAIWLALATSALAESFEIGRDGVFCPTGDAPVSLAHTASPSACESTTRLLTSVRILSTKERPPFYSGSLMTWAIIRAAMPDGLRRDMYVLFLEEDQRFPNVGSLCSVTARELHIGGLTARGAAPTGKRVLVPSVLRCGAAEYDYRY